MLTSSSGINPTASGTRGQNLTANMSEEQRALQQAIADQQNQLGMTQIQSNEQLAADKLEQDKMLADKAREDARWNAILGAVGGGVGGITGGLIGKKW